jgi:hypothetical protein
MVAQAGSTLNVKEEWLSFPPGLAIDVGDGGVILKGKSYPDGTKLLVDPAGNLVERAASTSVMPTDTPVSKIVFGPTSGSLVHNAEDDQVSDIESVVKLRNFVVQIRFFNPYQPNKIGWDYAIFFRSQGSNEQYRLIITCQNRWKFGYGASDNWEITGGALPNLNIAVGDSNDLRLVVTGKTARFDVNGSFVSTLDVSRYMTAGTIMAVTGALNDDEITGKLTRYEGFTIWSLPDDATETTPLPTALPTVTATRPDSFAAIVADADQV